MENSDKDDLITLYDMEGAPFTLTKAQAQKYYVDMQAILKNMSQELAKSVKGRMIIAGTAGEIKPIDSWKELWENPSVFQNEIIPCKKYEKDMAKREKKSWFKEQLSLFPEEMLKELELSATELRYLEDNKKAMFQDKVESVVKQICEYLQHKYPGVKVEAKIEENGPRFTITSYDEEKNLAIQQEIQKIFNL